MTEPLGGPRRRYAPAIFELGPAAGGTAFLSVNQGQPAAAVLVAMLHGRLVPFDSSITMPATLDEVHQAEAAWVRYIRVSDEPAGPPWRYVVDPLEAER